MTGRNYHRKVDARSWIRRRIFKGQRPKQIRSLPTLTIDSADHQSMQDRLEMRALGREVTITGLDRNGPQTYRVVYKGDGW
jgi:hypothetical protein